MANVTAGAAYKELEKVGDYISPNINAAADRLAKQGMQQKQLNADAKVATDKRLDEAYAGITVNTDALQAKATGFTNRDDIARDFAGAATERSMQYAEQAREAAQRGDWKLMNDLKGKIKRIEGDFKNTVNDEAILTGIFKGYQEKYAAGEVDDDEWLAFAAAMEKFDYQISLDENDNKVITAIEMDDDGQPVLGDDGNPKVITKKWADVVAQRDRPYEVVQLEDKEGKKGLIGDMLSTMGKRKYDEVTGQYIETNQTWDEDAENQFMGKVKALQSNDRTMYSILRQASGGEIIERKNSKLPKEEQEENKKLVEDYLRFQVKGGYDQEQTKKVAPRTAEQMADEAAKNRQVTREGQQITRDANADDQAIALRKMALDEWKAKNPQAKPLNKTETKELENDTVVVKFFDVAKEMAKLDKNAPEEDVQKVLDNSGLGFLIGANFDWFGLQGTQYNIGDVEGVNQKDVFKNIKGMADAAGLSLVDTDIKESIERIQKGTSGVTNDSGSTKEKPATTSSTANMTPQEKIEYYKNLNKK